MATASTALFPIDGRVVRNRGGVLGECPGTVIGHEGGEVLVLWEGQDTPIPYHPSLLALQNTNKEGI